MKLELLFLVLTITALQVASENSSEVDSDESDESDEAERSDASGQSDDDPIDAKSAEIFTNCIQKYNITLTEKLESKTRKAMCKRMCAMKATGMIMEDGQLNKEMILYDMSKMHSPTELKEIEEILDLCIPEALKQKDECYKPESIISCAETKGEELIKRNLERNSTDS